MGRNVGAGDKVLLSGHEKGPGPRVFRDAHPICNTAQTERVKGLGLHFRRMEKAGAPMGSGAVESLGKQFQRRLRG